MTRSIRFAALALGLFLLAPRASAITPPGPVDAFEEAHTAARTALVGRLLALAQWCHDNELFEDRDRAWRAVIEIDTDNLEARKGLRYARNVDGSWKEPAPRPAKNRNPAALDKLPAKRAEAIGPFRDAMLAEIEKDKVSCDVRKSVFTEILTIDPDDEPVHHLMGESRDEKSGWVLNETVTARPRRTALKAAIEAGKAAAIQTSPATPNDDDKVLSTAWNCGTEVENVRVLATGDVSQCEKISKACCFTAAAYEAVFGTPASYSPGFTIYVVARPGEKEAFIGKIPGLDDSQRAVLKRTIGGGIPGTWKIAVFEQDPARMQDCSVRHALAHLLYRGFKVGTSNAWVFEGFGLYLTREICGTRLTWFASGKGVATEGKNSPRAKLMVKDSNWMNEALQTLSRDPAPDLSKVLEVDLPNMSVDDMLISYALAAYLIEGRPQETPAILKAIGEGTKSAEALHAALGLTVPELQQHLVQWLKERKS
jgi:hypothetical protein